MHIFEKEKIVKKLIGREIIQICIGANELIFNFFPNGSLIIENLDEFFIENDSMNFKISEISRELIGLNFSSVNFTIGSVLFSLEEDFEFSVNTENQIYESISVNVDGQIAVF
jgi:hypothetical protein